MSLEQIFYDAGVDLALWAHEHEYERLYPMYDYNMCKGSEQEPYTNPRAPVHVVTGSAVSVWMCTPCAFGITTVTCNNLLRCELQNINEYAYGP